MTSKFSDSITKNLQKAVCDMVAQLAKHIAEKTKSDEKIVLQAIADFKGEALLVQTIASTKGKTKEAASIKGDLTIVEDYGPKSHVLCGEDTRYLNEKGIIKEINDKNGKKLLSFSAKLKVGSGWTVMDKSKLEFLKKFLDKAGYKYKSISFEQYMKDRNHAESSEDDSEKDKKTSKSKKASVEDDDGGISDKPDKSDKSDKSVKTTKLPKKAGKPETKKTNTIVTEINDHGNAEELDFGFIIMELPVGVRGEKKQVIVGTQNSQASKGKGVKSILPLTEEECTTATDKGWTVLTEASLVNVKKKDIKLFESIKHLVSTKDEDAGGAEEED